MNCCDGNTYTRKEYDSRIPGYRVQRFHGHTPMCPGLLIWNAQEEMATDRKH